MSVAASTPWAEIATALAVFAANVLSPGPNVFNTIAIALGSGRRGALMVVPVTIFPARSAGPGAIAAMVLGAAAVAAPGHLAHALAFSTRRAAQAYTRIGRWINVGVGIFFGSLEVTPLPKVASIGE